MSQSAKLEVILRFVLDEPQRLIKNPQLVEQDELLTDLKTLLKDPNIGASEEFRIAIREWKGIIPQPIPGLKLIFEAYWSPHYLNKIVVACLQRFFLLQRMQKKL